MLCGEALKVDEEQVDKSLYKREVPTKATRKKENKNTIVKFLVLF